MLDYTITSYSQRLNIVNLILEKNKKFNLETLGTYLLLSNEDNEKKENIKIYTNRALFEKAILNTQFNDEIKVFVDEKNWKKEKKQKIIASDKKKEVLQDYWNYIILAEKEKNELNSKKITNTCKKIIYDMKVIKDQLLGTIYFKHIGEETTEYSIAERINYNNINHIKKCLKLESKNLSKWIGCICYDMNNLVNQLKLTDKQKEILKLWRIDGSTLRSIAIELNVDHKLVFFQLQLIFKKIQKKIEHTK